MAWIPPGPAWLFCPADRPERYAKAAETADVAIIDLEDAVAAAGKPAARESLVASALDIDRTVVRVNAHGTEDFALDLQALSKTGYRRVMLAKTESASQLNDLADYDVVVLIESPLGAVDVQQIVRAPNVVGTMWGAEDLVAALGGNSSRFADGRYRDVAAHVRTSTLLAAKARGLFALDSVVLDIGDLDTLRAEADDAVAVGFDGKVAIHPSQVQVIRDAFAPTADEINWATGVLDVAASGKGVFTFEGKMVDAPVLRQAERIMQRAATRHLGP
ncbi:HpcH/HpaI aldolase/citrate lyase family protein [Rhodococcoides yunnanense]|uniref:HpcH/HpaI aldolase/citrate lyase family protein n=1 Tax=Rhodococcoides yunnanense TaxID=278209 RepID=UPI00093311E2|nr:CoA ester lyase [Rhodococcus yunnanensis]